MISVLPHIAFENKAEPLESWKLEHLLVRMYGSRNYKGEYLTNKFDKISFI